MPNSQARCSPQSMKKRCANSGPQSDCRSTEMPNSPARRSPQSMKKRCANSRKQVSNGNGTFSLSGRSTNHVSQRPSLIRNQDVQGLVATNAAQIDTQTFGTVSTRMARPTSKLQAARNSEAVSTSPSSPNQTDINAAPSPNQTDINAAPVLKTKGGRGCNKPEEAPANLADRRHISLTRLGGWPDKKVSRTIGSHLKTGLLGGYPNWTAMPKDNKRTLWNKFVCTYVWDPVEDGAIRGLWEKSMSTSLTNAAFDAHKYYVKHKKKPKWCADSHWIELLAYWRSPGFLKRSEAAKENRSKAPRACHTTRSKTMERAAIEKAQERGVPEIPYIENYADTHMKRNHNDPNAALEWIDPKFKDVYDQYVEECSKDFGEDRTLWPVEVDAEKWTKAIGSPQKGRIMGLSIHADPEELGFNTRKRSLFSRTSLSSRESRREEIDELKKIAEDATVKCTQLQALVESQKAQHDELMEFVRSQMQGNRNNQIGVESSSVVDRGRHTTNEEFNIDDFLG